MYVFGFVEQWLSLNTSVVRVEDLVEQACNVLNQKYPSYGATCQSFVRDYYPVVLNAILQYVLIKLIRLVRSYLVTLLFY